MRKAVEYAAPLAGELEGLLAGLGAASDVALDRLGALAARGRTVAAQELTARLLRATAADADVVCLVDDADGVASAWLNQLLLTLGYQIARDRLRILIVLAVAELRAEEGSRVESDSARVARALLADRVAAAWILEPATETELRREFPGASSAVVRSLHAITAGELPWARELFDEWRAHGTVAEDADGVLEFAVDGQERLDPVLDILIERLAGLAPDAVALVTVRSILACGALEGRCFSAPAVARALGRSTDETIRHLCRLADPEASTVPLLIRRPPVVLEAALGATRTIERFEFADHVAWRTMERYGNVSDRRREVAGALADALADVYSKVGERVIDALARLSREAGRTESARHYQALSDYGPSRDLALDRDYYLQAAERLGGNRACLAVARKLLKRSYHTLRELGDQALQPA